MMANKIFKLILTSLRFAILNTNHRGTEDTEFHRAKLWELIDAADNYYSIIDF